MPKSAAFGLSLLLSSFMMLSAQATGSRFQITKVYSETASLLRRQTSVPLRLPTQVAGLQSGDEIYAIIRTADADSYVVVLGAIPDCEGQHVCAYGTFVGTTRPLDQVGEYSMAGRGTPVKLQYGIVGRFYAGSCGAYCDDSVVSWSEGKYHYIVGLKAGGKHDLIVAANSAIRWGRTQTK